MLTFSWISAWFRYDAYTFVPNLDTAIALYSLYLKLDPQGVGQLFITDEDNVQTEWRSEADETIREMFENALSEDEE